MTRQGLHDGLRHAAVTMTTQVTALVAMALCTLLAYQLHELSRSTGMNLDAIVGSIIKTVKYNVLAVTQMHDYAAVLVMPALLVGCLALGALYIWNQKDS